MKKIIGLALVLSVLLCVYFLFKPVFTHNVGWKTFSIKEQIEPEKTHGEELFKKADEALIKNYKEIKTPALSVTIYRGDTVLYENMIGYADIENRKRITSNTRFRIGSTSKAVTSVGLGILLEKEKLNLETKVSDYFPNKYDKLSNLTVKEVASHTSGIRNYGTCFCFPIWEYYNNKEYNSIEDAINVFAGDDLLFKPSASFSYSSYNYTILSGLMEKASKEKFSSFMIKEVFNPLNMKNTSAFEKGNLAKFYQVEEKEYKLVPAVNNSNKIAGGGFVSTSNDLAKLGSSILTNKLFNKDIKELLFTPVKLSNGKVNKQNYGLGWRIVESTKPFKDKRKVRVIHHGGTAMGATAMLILLPEYNISMSAVINKSASGISDLVKVLYEIIDILTHDDKVHFVEL